MKKLKELSPGKYRRLQGIYHPIWEQEGSGNFLEDDEDTLCYDCKKAKAEAEHYDSKLLDKKENKNEG